MSLIKQTPVVINIASDLKTVISTFLRLFLAHERLTERQLDVTTSLITRYAKYIEDGVKEPYASTLLFSPGTRKECSKEINISAAHFNNTLNALKDKNVLSKGDEGTDSYIINPQLIPVSALTFKFKIAKQGQNST